MTNRKIVIRLKRWDYQWKETQIKKRKEIIKTNHNSTPKYKYHKSENKNE